MSRDPSLKHGEDSFPIAVCCRLVINVAVGKSVAVFGIFMDFTPVTGVSAERLIDAALEDDLAA